MKETFQGKTVWEGDVEVFDLIGHPKAKRCYAWAYDVETGSRTLAVLELPPRYVTNHGLNTPESGREPT